MVDARPAPTATPHRRSALSQWQPQPQPQPRPSREASLSAQPEFPEHEPQPQHQHDYDHDHEYNYDCGYDYEQEYKPDMATTRPSGRTGPEPLRPLPSERPPVVPSASSAAAAAAAAAAEAEAAEAAEAATTAVAATAAARPAPPAAPVPTPTSTPLLLHSITSFDDLHLPPSLLRGIYAMHFTRPSKIQERALPLLLQDPPRNMIAQSQSGTGKTAAFILTMLSRIDLSRKQTQAIALAPSRELARQTMDVALAMGQFTSVQSLLAVPDAPGTKRSDGTSQAQLVIGTPGKILDLMRSRVLSTKYTRVFVLDEADKMLDAQGFGEQSVRVKNAMPTSCQLVLFSATFPDHVREFASKIAPGGNEIRLRQDELNVDGIKQFFMDCADAEARYDVLVELYSLLTIGQSIIFCSRRDVADRVARRMGQQGHRVASLHGKFDTVERDRTIDLFRRGDCKVLISTNVLARGIDVPQVNMVVNYDLPLLPLLRGNSTTAPQSQSQSQSQPPPPPPQQQQQQQQQPDVETYLHRIGRTGRFGRAGVSINFVHDQESWYQLRQIEAALGVSIVRVPTGAGEGESMERILKAALKA